MAAATATSSRRLAAMSCKVSGSRAGDSKGVVSRDEVELGGGAAADA